MGGGAWWAAVHGVAQSRTRLSDFAFTHWRRKWQPTPCSCLENPGDGRAWWVAVYGVAQSRTRLKRLSSSSNMLGSEVHGIFKSTAVGCHFLRQRIFPTQGSNPGLPQCKQTLHRLSHKGSPVTC